MSKLISTLSIASRLAVIFFFVSLADAVAPGFMWSKIFFYGLGGAALTIIGKRKTFGNLTSDATLLVFAVIALCLPHGNLTFILGSAAIALGLDLAGAYSRSSTPHALPSPDRLQAYS